jgi:hypothetical protein
MASRTPSYSSLARFASTLEMGNASERRASLEKDNAQADLTAISGKADTTGAE